uniref:Cholinergic receptor nicotinic epsilon subunit n=1 Tax=Gopherus evgoodei TaxID=1825980 RepID=A0A8C4YQ33_9SAUR
MAPGPGASGGNEELRLYEKLFANYDKNTRPARRPDDTVPVQIMLTLTNLISLNEKEETLTTNVWLKIEWVDYRLNYSNSEFEGIRSLRVPSDMVWLPDIVLENNIDGQFEIAYYANVLVYPGGAMYWLPPAIYRSTCAIEVTYFPFDWQNCSLVFQSQTYSANEVELQGGWCLPGSPQKGRGCPPEPAASRTCRPAENGEWAIRHRPAWKVLHPELGREALGFQEIRFSLIIQRKPLFYVINIIVPCVLISSLVVLVYFLPAQAGGQKCTLSISVLLAQTVFLFLIAQKVPETSLSVPLIGKYLMFVMGVATLIVMNCVIVLNVSLRTPNTHCMSEQLKHPHTSLPQHPGENPWVLAPIAAIYSTSPHSPPRAGERTQESWLSAPTPLPEPGREPSSPGFQALPLLPPCSNPLPSKCRGPRRPDAPLSAAQEMENWVLIGKVIDKLCFCAAILLFTIGTLSIFLTGHFNQVPDDPFPLQPDL